MPNQALTCFPKGNRNIPSFNLTDLPVKVTSANPLTCQGTCFLCLVMRVQHLIQSCDRAPYNSYSAFSREAPRLPCDR